MIILFFHVFCILDQYVFRRFYNVRKTLNPVDEKEEKFVEVEKPQVEDRTQREMLKRRYSQDDDDEEFKATVKFSPPAYIQRYNAVQKVLTDPCYGGKLKKIVDFGCDKLEFFNYLKHMPGVEELLFVDIDRFILDMYKVKASPLHVDYLQTRNSPLIVKVLEGSVTEPDKVLENCDAVVCIEIIEHLYPDYLLKLPFNIFGFIRPKVVIITTPNADFNVLFKNMSKFRHPDHKFEWTRKQFQDWANNVVSRFPEYSVSFQGICPGSPGTEDLGTCTQMAIFNKIKDENNLSLPGVENLYRTVAEFDYPYKIDNRSDEEKILDDAVYYIRKFSLNQEEITEEISLEKLLSAMSNFNISPNDLKKILENGNWTVTDREDGPIVVVPPISPFSTPSYVSESSDQDIFDFDDTDEEPTVPVSAVYSNHNSESELVIDNWDSIPFLEIESSENHNGANNSVHTNVACNTPTIYEIDLHVDDVATESQSTDLVNSADNNCLVISETKISEDSETLKNPSSQASSIFINSKITDASTSFFSTQSLEESKSKSLENNSFDKNSSVCSMFLEPSKMSENMNIENLSSILESAVISPSVDEIFKSFRLTSNVSSNSANESTFEEPKFTSSPHVSVLFSEKEKINEQITEFLDSDPDNKCTNVLELSKNHKLKDNFKKTDIKFNHDNDYHDYDSCLYSNECLMVESNNSKCLLEKSDSEKSKEVNNFNGKILDTSIKVQRDTELETSDVSQSLPNCRCQQIVDSGYSNSHVPDLSPENDSFNVSNNLIIDSDCSNSDSNDSNSKISNALRK